MGYLTCLAQLIALQGNEFVTTFIGVKRIEENGRGGGTKKERGKGISNLKSLFEIPRNSKNDF